MLFLILITLRISRLFKNVRINIKIDNLQKITDNFPFCRSSVGQNYTLSGGGVVIITLAVGSAPTRGFSLHLFSSGLADQTPDFTGFMQTSGETGNLTYPSHGGGYDNFENALFIIAPATPQQRFISFLAMDLENWSGCTADAVSVYSWLNGMYALITRYLRYSEVMTLT